MLSTENKTIPQGENWTKIELGDTRSFSVQNTAEVLMEYSYTNGITKGSYLTPYTVVNGIRQDFYVRFNYTNHTGTISITWDNI